MVTLDVVRRGDRVARRPVMDGIRKVHLQRRAVVHAVGVVIVLDVIKRPAVLGRQVRHRQVGHSGAARLHRLRRRRLSPRCLHGGIVMLEGQSCGGAADGDQADLMVAAMPNRCVLEHFYVPV